MSSAPRDTTPSIVLITPDARPAPSDAKKLDSLFYSGLDKGTNVATDPPMQ